MLLSRNPFALEIQEELLRDHGWEDDREYRHLVDALVSSQSTKGIARLVESVLNNPKSTILEKTVILNSLRIANASKWSGPAHEILIPFLKDIESSVPMDISD